MNLFSELAAALRTRAADDDAYQVLDDRADAFTLHYRPYGQLRCWPDGDDEAHGDLSWTGGDLRLGVAREPHPSEHDEPNTFIAARGSGGDVLVRWDLKPALSAGSVDDLAAKLLQTLKAIPAAE